MSKLDENIAAQSDDFFAVVDENDVVVDRQRRSFVHKNGLMHRAVHAIVIGNNGKILAQMRSKYKDRAPLCYTTSSSGHVDYGETYEDALVRETKEELGIDTELADYIYIGKLDACKQTDMEFVKVYVLRHNGPFVFPPAEIDSLDWYTKAEIERLMQTNPEKFSGAFVYVYKYFVQICKKNSNLRLKLEDFLNMGQIS